MAGYLSRSVPALVRLMARIRVDYQTGCWLWTAAVNSKGYGKMYLNGKSLGAHVVAWILFRGPIPKGHLVCHHCDIPRCCNPYHEFTGTYSDNINDAITKGRFTPPCLYGASNGNSTARRAQ